MLIAPFQMTLTVADEARRPGRARALGGKG